MSRVMKINLVSKLYLACIIAEIKPYSCEAMRDSSKSEEDDVYESQSRGNA